MTADYFLRALFAGMNTTERIELINQLEGSRPNRLVEEFKTRMTK